MGRVGRDLPRLSAYFQLYKKVGEVQLAEAMQSSIITQLRLGGEGKKNDLFKELSELSTYFKTLKRYHHALPLSKEAVSLCIELHGDKHIETAVQLHKHANLL